MSGQNEGMGMRKLSIFVTADALLAAVLLVWAQLWIQPFAQLWAEWFGKEQSPQVAQVLENLNFNVGIGLAWTYAAVLLALFALAWVGWCSIKDPLRETPWVAIGLFAASLIMAVLNVGQSFVMVGIKLLDKNSEIFQALTKAPGFLIWFSPCLVIVIIGLSLWGACRISKDKYKNALWVRRYLPWIIEVIIIVIATLFILWLVLSPVYLRGV